MSPEEISYIVFGIVLVLAVIFDLGLLSKKDKAISIKQAFFQTLFWVGLGIGYGIFVWFEDGRTPALEYMSAYLMEWGLSIDNIFVFILIFSFFKIPAENVNRVLLLGILLAIVLRVIFITVGIALIARFHWILYIFGAFLLYTGAKMFFAKSDQEFDPEENTVYRFLKRFLPLTKGTYHGQYTVRIQGKRYFTPYFVVLVLLAATDLVFALDSIPAVFAITQDKMVIYTSNIFAVLGLRSLFFLLRGAVNKFQYLQEGIAVVLVFIGLKMLITFLGVDIDVAISLAVIIGCLSGSIFLSIIKNKQEDKKKRLHDRSDNL